MYFRESLAVRFLMNYVLSLTDRIKKKNNIYLHTIRIQSINYSIAIISSTPHLIASLVFRLRCRFNFPMECLCPSQSGRKRHLIGFEGGVELSKRWS